MAIVFDAASNSGNKSASSSYSWAHTAATGAMLTVSIASYQAAIVSSVTYGSTSLVFLCSQIAGAGNGGFAIELWGTAAPLGAGATANITVTFDTVTDSASAGVSSTGQFAVDPYADGVATNHAVNVGATDATVDLTVVVAGSLVIGAVVANDGTVTAGAGQTERANVSTGFNSGVTSSQAIAAAGVVTTRFTNIGAVKNWGVGAVSLRTASPPVISGGDTAGYSVAYHFNSTIATLTATNDDGGSVAWTITGGADAALFNLNSSTAVLTFLAPATTGAKVLVVRATNSVGFDEQTITVTVGSDPSVSGRRLPQSMITGSTIYG